MQVEEGARHPGEAGLRRAAAAALGFLNIGDVEAAAAVLREALRTERLGALTEEIVLIGGQAVNFWADFYAVERKIPVLSTSGASYAAPHLRRR